MANIIYLTISENRQGKISSGCGTEKSIGNKWQKGHESEIWLGNSALNVNIRC